MLLQLGSTGSEVTALQERLNYIGYNCGAGTPDGYFGVSTQDAVEDFQRDNDLTVDGIVGDATWAKIQQAKPVLKINGTVNYVAYVQMLQNKLSLLGYGYGTDPFGYFETNTRDAVMTFQQRNSLTADGIVGGRSWNKLYASDVVISDGYLKLGSYGSAVTALQTRLNQLGYNCGTPDGVFGNGTKANVQKFQSDYGLISDGIVGPKTQDALNGSYKNIKQGSRGTAVTTLQTRLNELGYNCGTPDGIFGSGTNAAVVSFQKNNALTADGIVGVKTWAELMSSHAKGPGTISSTILHKGDKGEAVEWLQERLLAMDYYIGRAGIDGIFGDATYSAVVEFQTNNSLTADGIVGEQTWTKLHAINAISNPDDPEGFTVIRKGRRGDDVQVVQQRLIDLGYSCGLAGADRIFGPSTFNAVLEFQRLNGLRQDGIVGQETYTALFSSSAIACDYSDSNTLYIKYGSKGENVSEVQARLIELGYSCGNFGADGVFGNATYSAVIRFQQLNNLSPDGVVGPATKECLFSSSAVPFSEETSTSEPPYYGNLTEYINQVIRVNEVGNVSNYKAVNPSDGSSLSIGVFQWHGSRAYQLLLTIKTGHPTETQAILAGTTLYNEIGNDPDQFSNRTLNSQEAEAVGTLISTSYGIQAQDDLSEDNLESWYMPAGTNYGITNSGCMILFCDMYHQRGSGSMSDFIDTYFNGSLANVTLSQLYTAAITDQPSKEPRRTKVKNKAEAYVGGSNPGSSSDSVFDKLINVAMNEVGYEHARGYSKYGDFMNSPSAAWCNCFVSWSAYQVGLMDVLIPGGKYTETTKKWFQNRSAFMTRASGYIPQKGDCIYFLYDDPPGRTVTHIALVRENSDGTTVKTVEGNLGKSGDSNIRQVRAEEYNLTYASIVGYGSVRTVADAIGYDY